jgi:NTE family protein
MQHSILAGKMALRPPDIMVRPDIVDVRTLEFHRVDAIFQQAGPARDRLKRELEAILG